MGKTGRRGYIGRSKKSSSKKKKEAERTLPEKCKEELLRRELPDSWTVGSCTADSLTVLCVQEQTEEGFDHFVVPKAIKVFADGHCEVYALGEVTTIASTPALEGMPSILSPEDVLFAIQYIAELKVCCGNGDTEFLELRQARKDLFLGKDGQKTNYVDKRVSFEPDCPAKGTIRHMKCARLVKAERDKQAPRCAQCTEYRGQLRVMKARAAQNAFDGSKYKRNDVMTTPEKQTKLQERAREFKILARKASRMQVKVEKLLATHKDSALPEDDTLNQDTAALVGELDEVVQLVPQESFKRIFWEQQKQASKIKGEGMRWHPLILRWCLYMKYFSTKAYETLRGVLKLPSTRTLRDYTHWAEAKPGFQLEVNRHLAQISGIEKAKEKDRYLVLIFDEIKIKEGLVYHKHTGQVVGFVHLGEVNNDLETLERRVNGVADEPTIATHMLSLMVRGVFTSLEYPYAHFQTAGITGQELYPLVWEAIRQLEGLGFYVICISCDGASPNRKFFRLHGEYGLKDGVIYKTVNRYSVDKRDLYFMSDVPHLLKTIRNCWSHSDYGQPRLLQNKGKYILWSHLKTILAETRCDTGLYVGKGLQQQHVSLNSFSRMRVDLAAQTLSTTVADLMQLHEDRTGNDDMRETREFVRKVDAFFDCLNVRETNMGHCKRKPNCLPYRSPSDPRFKELEVGFLGYLRDWEQHVNDLPGYTAAQRETMLLSRETREGIKISVYSFVEMAKKLLKVPEVQYLLSEKFTQDPLEEYFGYQRGRGRRNDNPTADGFLQNNQTLTTIGTMTNMGPLVRGNVRGRQKHDMDIDSLSAPLLKRKRHNST